MTETLIRYIIYMYVHTYFLSHLSPDNISFSLGEFENQKEGIPRRNLYSSYPMSDMIPDLNVIKPDTGRWELIYE